MSVFHRGDDKISDEVSLKEESSTRLLPCSLRPFVSEPPVGLKMTERASGHALGRQGEEQAEKEDGGGGAVMNRRER